MTVMHCVGCQRELRTDEPAAFLGIPDGEVYPVCRQCMDAATVKHLKDNRRYCCIHGSVCRSESCSDCDDFEFKEVSDDAVV